MKADASISAANSSDEVAAVRALFLEYAASLDFDLCFQGFDEELAALPGCYAAPKGCLLLARDGPANAVGCVGVRRLTAGEAEMKRLYVRPEFRGQALGRRLAEAAAAFAWEAGYTVLRLDTIAAKMAEAEAMYRDMGFVRTAAYYDNPVPGATYYALTR